MLLFAPATARGGQIGERDRPKICERTGLDYVTPRERY